jgi:hypothetical protein
MSGREFFGTDYLGTDLVFTWEDGRPIHPNSIRSRAPMKNGPEHSVPGRFP